MIQRNGYLERVRRALSRNPIVAIVGPRQCGKTTLAQQFLPESEGNYPTVAKLPRPWA